MGPATMIRLRNGYRDQLPECLASLSEDPSYQDTVLVCQDGVVRASRFILTLCLPFLRRPLKDRQEDEVVVVMPNFTSKLVKEAMLKIFHASGKIDEKSKIESQFENFEGNLTKIRPTEEEHDLKTKDEDFLQIKHEVDSDEDLEDQWEPEENGFRPARKSKEESTIMRMISGDEDDNYDENYDEDYDEDMWDIEDEKPKPNKTGKKSQKRRIPENADINWNCHICDQPFANRAEYKKHEDETHVKEGMIVCPYENCDKRYRVTETRNGQSRLIVRHIERHKAKGNESEHVCSECGKTFKNRKSLVPHMLLHTGIKNHQCDVCNQMFCSRGNLLSHKAQSKCGAEEVVCPICGHKCNNKYYLKRHLMKHTGERPYKCEFEGCGKGFFDSQTLQNHRKIHLDIKEYQCSLCPKAFRQRSALVIHMKRHNGVGKDLDYFFFIVSLLSDTVSSQIKEHHCKECGKAFVEPAGARNCKHNSK